MTDEQASFGAEPKADAARSAAFGAGLDVIPLPKDPAREEAAAHPSSAPRLERGRGTAQRLDPAYVSAARLAGVVFVGFIGVASLVGGVAMWWLTDLSTLLKGGIVGLLVLQLLALGYGCYRWPALEFAHLRYRVGTEGIEIKRGVFWRHVVTVPLSRIQHTDVSQGPIQRRFGLADLVIHTAGTHQYEVTLGGVSHGVALRIRDALLEAEPEPGDAPEDQRGG